jgi:Flp pilus assembly protein TadD
MNKDNYLTLSQIGLYNPQRLDDTAVENLFVVRKKLFNFLLEKVNSETIDSIPQHYLIIAQRGMGKTTLLKRMEVELRKQDYKSRFIPLLFPEEQYNLKNLAEFWLNSLDALADTLEQEKATEAAKAVDNKVQELAQIKDDEQLAKDAFSFLKSFTKSLGRRPVLLIDNMSFIFDRLVKSEQHKLRAWLMENASPILLGASAVAIEDTYDYGAPFYDAFQIYYLKKLDFEELIDILINLAKLTNSESLISEINREKARIKTLHQLTGGNPRTAVMLFKLIVKGFSKEINDDLEALLDEITPLYKARFEELPTQMQVIVDAIALFWDPINIEQLRHETRYENNQLSPQLKRLVELGWIEKLNAFEAKGSAYQISERFFNIWFLMRRSSRRQKKELYCLSKFLETFYGDDLENIAKNRLNLSYRNLDAITYDLAMAEVIKDPKLRKQLQSKSYAELRKLAKNNPEIRKQFEIPTETKLEKQEQALLTMINEDSHNGKAWFDLGYLYDLQIENYPEAEKAYLQATKLKWKPSWAWHNLGNLYLEYFQNYEEAEKAYRKAIELDETFAIPWNGLGILYQNHLHKYEEAEKAFHKAIELDENLIHPWNGLGNLYQDHLQKFEEAEKAYLKASELNENYVSPKYNLVFLYRDRMNRIKEAKKIFERLEVDREIEDSYWLHKALFDLYDKNEGIAKESLKKAFAKIENKLPAYTQDDWWRFGAVTSKLGYGKWFTNILKEEGFDIILSPYYVAIKALNEKDTEGYLNSKAVEIREPAKKLMEIMKKYS